MALLAGLEVGYNIKKPYWVASSSSQAAGVLGRVHDQGVRESLAAGRTHNRHRSAAITYATIAPPPAHHQQGSSDGGCSSAESELAARPTWQWGRHTPTGHPQHALPPHDGGVTARQPYTAMSPDFRGPNPATTAQPVEGCIRQQTHASRCTPRYDCPH